ncbi:hypothetical protein Hdeb2414_s0140g00810721 [Helianthus debilis subsp. tardiflorus]
MTVLSEIGDKTFFAATVHKCIFIWAKWEALRLPNGIWAGIIYWNGFQVVNGVLTQVRRFTILCLFDSNWCLHKEEYEFRKYVSSRLVLGHN